MAQDPSQATAWLEEVESAIRAAVRQKLRVTLSASDHREANLDAQDLLGEIRLKLLRKQQSPGEGVENFPAYAATVAYHACADYLRAKYPERTSLKNCLRRLMDKLPDYAVWPAESGDLCSGFAGWRGQKKTVADGARLAAFRENQHQILPVPGKAFADWTLEDWRKLLDAVFGELDAPLLLDDLIALLAPLVGVEDVPDTSDPPDEDGLQEVDLLPSQGMDSYTVRLTRERLLLLWGAVGQLLPWHRAAYLLNMPDGEIDVFLSYNVASLEEIAKSLDLKEKNYMIAWLELGVPASSQASTGEESLAKLWKYLPLEDNCIAKMLQVTRPQVIGYRNKAVERLRRNLKHLG
ncbi:MAG: sigma-70 family RNA polymerase sigma factor [Acidobacteria bacterium]|nr:sigma-70 family RNA polymerase sigma factor [Acidobacteriota bacterium]